ncbi:EAL domain-containing protein [Micromonospora sp. B11E3]|uniref:putative bifunctional diguanylate cyclase/phosphodiesterase n=1 Tax=Micromonospora sp. B11E3 TaxID=3153562 RepID=UPI00325C9942
MLPQDVRQAGVTPDLWSGAGFAVAVAVLLIEAAWLVAGLPGEAVASDVGAIVVAGWATVACVGAARRHSPPLRRFWALLAATMGLAALGRMVWTAQRLGDDSLPHTPLVGALFTAGIVTGTAALLCSVAARSAIGRARAVLDGVIVGLSLIPIGWVLVFRDVATADLADPARTLGLLYPMLDLAQLTLLVAVTGTIRPRWRPLTVIGASLVTRAVADAAYVSLVAHGEYTTGSPVDVCWPLSYLLVGAATRYPPPPGADEVDETAETPLPPWWRVALPCLPVGGAIVAVHLARRPDGQTPQLVLVTVMALLGVLAARQGLAANENLRLVARLRALAYTDQLTGLPNRLAFTRRLRRALRAGGPVAVLLLDLDGFKQVNDRFGHGTGDALLTGIAGRMRRVVGDDGTVARLGGDEFAVLVDASHQVRPEPLAERLLAALQPPEDEEKEVGGHTSASIGIAEYGPQHTSHTDLLRDADIAMYAAKAAGKSAYRTCTAELREAAVTRAELIADLRRAIDEQELHLEFQPIVDLATGTVRSAEALVRWRHPRLGLLSPARFLPLAEETGLIVPIDRWVIHEACRAAATWRDRAPEATVAVNIAAAHLRRPDLIATVTEATAAAGLAPRALTLELTESALIDGSETVLDRLRQLRELGIRIAIDDFGTGYSSLSYLHRIPATELKIDRSFVARLGADARAYATVEMVTRLAGAFDLSVVAEGVETDGQHTAVTAIGCLQGQGWRYGRPTGLADLRATLLPAAPA